MSSIAQLVPRIRFEQVSFSPPAPLRLTYRATLRLAARPIATTLVPSYAGLYVVLVYDPSWSPLPYRPLYFGQAKELSERVCRSHEKYSAWEEAAGGTQLYVAFCNMPSALTRNITEQRLIERYLPQCNDIYNAMYGL
jgi:hypothetical protein